MTGHWSYCDEDGCGPTFWPTGDQQSPIDIDEKHVSTHETYDSIKFINYNRPIDGDIVNNGHSVQVVLDARSEHPEIFGGGLDQVYRLVQYHFHWGSHSNEGSEHTIGGQHYPAELHLVHQGTEDPEKLAVVGVFLQIDDDGTPLQREQNVLRRLKNPSAATKISNVILSHKLPQNQKSFWRYEGSLTTPPCSEVVTWTLFTDPIGITQEQLDLFRQVKDSNQQPLLRNFRPVQNLNQRTVLHVLAK